MSHLQEEVAAPRIFLKAVEYHVHKPTYWDQASKDVYPCAGFVSLSWPNSAFRVSTRYSESLFGDASHVSGAVRILLPLAAVLKKKHNIDLSNESSKPLDVGRKSLSVGASSASPSLHQMQLVFFYFNIWTFGLLPIAFRNKRWANSNLH